jgi:hypothetical protein
VPTSYVPAIDPVLLDTSLGEGRDSDEDLVIYSHQSTALGPLTTVQDCTTLNGTVNTPGRSFFEREMDSLMSSISNILSDAYTCPDKSQDDEATLADTQKEKGKNIQKRSACPTNTGNDRRKIRRISAGQGMTTMANLMENAMETIAEKFTRAMQQAPRSEALQVTAQAIEIIEMEEGFSDEDLKDAALVIGNSPEVANMYLHMKSKTACRNYLLDSMEKRRK